MFSHFMWTRSRNVGKDREIRRTQDGRPIANLSVATSETWRDKATGERGERCFGTDPAWMRPGDQHGRCHDGSDTGERGEFRGVGGDECVELGPVRGDLMVKVADVAGQPDSLAAAGGQPGGFLACSPPGDRGDLTGGEGSAGIHAEVDGAQ